MYAKKGKRKAARHHGPRKNFAVKLSRDVYRSLHLAARLMDATPNQVIERLLSR